MVALPGVVGLTIMFCRGRPPCLPSDMADDCANNRHIPETPHYPVHLSGRPRGAAPTGCKRGNFVGNPVWMFCPDWLVGVFGLTMFFP
jgi:hypothetical protein